MGKKDKMGKKSKLALSAKECRPIKSFFVTKIPTTSNPSPGSAKTRKKTATRSVFIDVGDALSDAFDWPDNATDYMNGRNFAAIVARQSCRLVCMKKCLTACGGTYANGCKGMHCQPFTTKEAIFKAGVILIACKVWAKRGVPVCLFDMGGVGSELFFNQVDDQLFDFATKDKEVIFKYTTFDRKGTHISNYAVWRFMEDGKEADSVQRQII